MIKSISLVAFLLFALFCDAQKVKVKRKGVMPVTKTKTTHPTKYAISQFNGKWEEFERTSKGTNNDVGFTDTLRIQIDKGKATVRNGVSMTMNGEAEIEDPNILDVAGDDYTVVSLTSTKLTLDDGAFIHRFQKMSKFNFEDFGQPEISEVVYDKKINVDANNLNGKWMVYRRKAEPGAADQDALIKSLTITKTSMDGTSAVGELTFYQSYKAETAPATFSFNDGNMQIVSGSHTWNFYTYKGDGKEFVFGIAGQLTYYAKPGE